MKFSNYLNKTLTNYLANECKIVEMTNIQELALPKILKKQNTVVVSSTGSGKTLCYLLPIFLNSDLQLKATQNIIVVPTNELSKQVIKVIRSFKKFYDFSVYDGFSKHKANKNINAQIVLASPTELIKLIRSGQLNLNNLSTVVFDEADMLFDFFKNGMFSILNYLRKISYLQYCLFSATLHESLANSIKDKIPNCKVIKDKNDIWTNENITHYLVNIKDISQVTKEYKLQALLKLLNEINPFFCLIFANDKNDVLMISKQLIQAGYKTGVLYSGLDHKIRRDVLLKANKLQYQVLVATDLAARGIDLPGVSDVISFDLPLDDIYYIHRAGRTGRAKYTGNSYIFVDSNFATKIDKLKQKIKFKKLNINL